MFVGYRVSLLKDGYPDSLCHKDTLLTDCDEEFWLNESKIDTMLYEFDLDTLDTLAS